MSSPNHSHSHLWPGVPLALASALLFGASALSANVQPLDPWHHPWIYRLLR